MTQSSTLSIPIPIYRSTPITKFRLRKLYLRFAYAINPITYRPWLEVSSGSIASCLRNEESDWFLLDRAEISAQLYADAVENVPFRDQKVWESRRLETRTGKAHVLLSHCRCHPRMLCIYGCVSGTIIQCGIISLLR